MARPAHGAESARDVETSVERRKSPRTPALVRVTYRSVDVLFSEFARNVNEGGMFIETDNPAPVDSVVALHFQLPGSEQPIRASARVVWTRERTGEEGPDEAPGMGLEFEELSQEARAEINRVIRRLRAGPR